MVSVAGRGRTIATEQRGGQSWCFVLGRFTSEWEPSRCVLRAGASWYGVDRRGRLFVGVSAYNPCPPPRPFLVVVATGSNCVVYAQLGGKVSRRVLGDFWWGGEGRGETERGVPGGALVSQS